MGEQAKDDSPLSQWLSGLAHDLADGQVAGYIALGGGPDGPARGYALVQLPGEVGPAAVGRHMERARYSVSERIAAALEAHAEHTRDLEARLAEATAYAEELREERDQALGRERGDEQHQAQRALEARIKELEADVRQWRQRAAVAEGEAMRARLMRGPDEDRGSAEQLAAFETELEATRAKLARVTQNWRDAEAKSDTAWRRVGEIQSELDAHKEQSVMRSAEQRRSAQLELAKVREDASMRLIGVRDQLIRSEQRCEALEARVRELEARIQSDDD